MLKNMKTVQKLAVQFASRLAHGGVAGKLAARCCHMHNSWQLVFPPLHHVMTYLPIAQPVFAQFRCFFHNFVHNFGIMARTKQTARKNTGEGAIQNSKFI